MPRFPAAELLRRGLTQSVQRAGLFLIPPAPTRFRTDLPDPQTPGAVAAVTPQDQTLDTKIS